MRHDEHIELLKAGYQAIFKRTLEDRLQELIAEYGHTNCQSVFSEIEPSTGKSISYWLEYFRM